MKKALFAVSFSVMFFLPRATLAEEKVDFDFTRMNAVIRAAQIYRLSSTPDKFEGKTLRVSGIFLVRVDPDTGKRHYGCLVGSECLCCGSGEVLEFDSPKDFKWPKDFPKEESRITVTGRLVMGEISDGDKNDHVFVMPRLVDVKLVSAQKH